MYVTELSRNSKQFQKWFIVQWFFRLTALIVSCWLNRQIIVKAISFFGSVTARKGHQIQLPGFAFIKSVHKDQIITVNEKKKKNDWKVQPLCLTPLQLRERWNWQFEH